MEEVYVVLSETLVQHLKTLNLIKNLGLGKIKAKKGLSQEIRVGPEISCWAKIWVRPKFGFDQNLGFRPKLRLRRKFRGEGKIQGWTKIKG